MGTVFLFIVFGVIAMRKWRRAQTKRAVASLGADPADGAKTGMYNNPAYRDWHDANENNSESGAGPAAAVPPDNGVSPASSGVPRNHLMAELSKMSWISSKASNHLQLIMIVPF